MNARAWSPRQQFARDLMALLCRHGTCPPPYMHPRQILHNGRKARR